MALRNPPFVPRRRFLSLGGGALLLSMLAACGNSRPRPDDSAERRLAERGYRPERHFGSESLRQTWFLEEDSVDVALLMPRESGPFPLLLYMPGLGESADAGLAWRQQWAEAGYGVLSLQGEEQGSAALRSERARNADFQNLAREAFAQPALQRRARLVTRVLAEVRRRQGAGQGPWTRLDASRPVLAGYDLGAQTALALAGERGRNGTALVPPLERVAAVLALSPHVDGLAGGFAQRYGAVAAPVLLVTGSDDSDSYGLVTNPAARQAPFRYLPEGRATLLLLYGANHRLFAGGADDAGATAGKGAPDGASGGAGGGMGGGRGGGMGGPGGGMGGPGGGMGGGMGGGPSGGMGGPGGGMDGGDRGGPGMGGGNNGKRQRLYVQHVSTAWLDEQVRQDPIAREWLERNAPAWLDEAARLQRR